jgi:hypothetical protein
MWSYRATVTETSVTRLTLSEAAKMMRAAVKDKSYRATPVGLMVGRYLRWFRNEWGATEPDDHVLYPEKRTAGGRLLVAYPKRRMSGPTLHRWWYRHLQAAGLVGAGMTSGLNMHRARHTFATPRKISIGSSRNRREHACVRQSPVS